MGAYSMSLSISLTIGPWMGTQLLALLGPVRVWFVMFALGALAASADGVLRASAPSEIRCSRRWILADIISMATELCPPRGTITSA